MLSNATLKAFVPTIKPEEAKKFYRDILGLTLLAQDQYAMEFISNGMFLRVITVPALTPQEFTALGWHVADIVSTIHGLNTKGIHCEKYGFFEQDELGVWISPSGAKVAWFKDPDGNILSLTE